MLKWQILKYKNRMQHRNRNQKIRILVSMISIIGLLFAITVLPVSAASARFYLLPENKTINGGDEFEVEIRLDTQGLAGNAVQANISYPEDKLELVRVDMADSDFEVAAKHESGGGIVKISRGTIKKKSGDLEIARLVLKVRSGGEAGVSFADGTVFVDAGETVPTEKEGRKYTLVASSAGPPPATTDDSPLVLSDVKVLSASSRKAVISWQTNRPATSAVEYGVDERYGLRAESSGLTKEHQVEIESEFLTADSLYYFRVSSTGEDGSTVVSDGFTFITDPAFPVWLIITALVTAVILTTVIVMAANPRTRQILKRRLRALSAENRVDEPIPVITLPPSAPAEKQQPVAGEAKSQSSTPTWQPPPADYSPPPPPQGIFYPDNSSENDKT